MSLNLFGTGHCRPAFSMEIGRIFGSELEELLMLPVCICTNHLSCLGTLCRLTTALHPAGCHGRLWECPVLVYCGGVVALTGSLFRHGRHQAIFSRILVNASIVQVYSLMVSLMQPNIWDGPGQGVFQVTNRPKFMKVIPARLVDCLHHAIHKH